MKYAYLKDTDLKILKAIGIRGKAWKYIIKKATGISHCTVNNRIRKLLERNFIREAGEEELEKPKGLKRKLYELTFKGILVVLNELQKEDDIEKLVNRNSTEIYFNIASKFLAAGLKDDAYFYIDSLKESVSRGFVNAELMDERDAKLAILMFLFKQINQRSDYFKKKAEMTENEGLREYYSLLLINATDWVVV